MNKLSRHNSALLMALSVIFTGTIYYLSQDAYASTLTMAKPLSFSVANQGIKVQGVVSGLGFAQTSPQNASLDGLLASKTDGAVISNAMLILTDDTGLFGFHLLAGSYVSPGVGLPLRDNLTFGPLPVGYLIINPSKNISVDIGKMPTLYGETYGFSYQRDNIQGGLLWDVENAKTRGVQVNYNKGHISLSVSLNDGYYTNRYNYFEGSLDYTINAKNSVTVYGGGNLGHTGTLIDNQNFSGYSSSGYVNASLVADNSDIYGLYYQFKNRFITILPEVQYMYTPKSLRFGTTRSSSVIGGDIHLTFHFTHTISLATALDYQSSSGPQSGLIVGYGNNSKAFSVQLTPTYSKDGYFVRAGLSFVHVSNPSSGDVFGLLGTNPNQFRAIVETGYYF